MANNKPSDDEWEVVDQKVNNSDDWETVDVKKKVSTTELQPSSNQKSPSESVGKEDISKSQNKIGDFAQNFMSNILPKRDPNNMDLMRQPTENYKPAKDDEYLGKIQKRMDERWPIESPFQKINSLKSWQNKLTEKYEPLIKQATSKKEVDDFHKKYEDELDDIAIHKIGLDKVDKGGEVGYEVPKSDIEGYEDELKTAYATIPNDADKKDNSYGKALFYKLGIGATTTLRGLTNALDFVLPYKKLTGLADDKNYNDMVLDEMGKRAKVYDQGISDYVREGHMGKAIGSAVLETVEQVPMLATIAMGNEAGLARVVVGTEGVGAGVSKYQEIQDIRIPQVAKLYNAMMTTLNFIALGEIGGNQTLQTAKNMVTKFGAEKAKDLLAKSYNTALQNASESIYQATSPALKGFTIGSTVQLSNNIVDKITINPNKDITEGVTDAGMLWAFMDKAMTLYGDAAKAKSAIDVARGKVPKDIPMEDYAISLGLILDKDHLMEQSKTLDESFQNKDKIDNINQQLNVVNQPRLVKEKINLLNKNISEELGKEYPDVNKVGELDGELTSIEKGIKVKMEPEVKELESKISNLKKQREGLYKEELTGTELQKQAKEEKDINTQLSNLLKQKQAIKQKFYDESLHGFNDKMDQDLHREDKNQAHDELKQILPDIKNDEQLKSKENEKAKRSNGNKGDISTVKTIEGERGEKETFKKEVENAKEVRSDKEIPIKKGEKSEISKDISGQNFQLRKEAGAETGNPEEGHEVIPAFVPEGMGEPEPSGAKTGQVEIGEKTKTPNAMKKILSTGDKNVFSREIKKDGKELGEVHVEEKPEGWEVKNVMVNEKGKGYGKQIYRELNEQAQVEGKVIKSDRPDKISGAAKGLWDSLVKSGEAEKLPDNSYKMISENAPSVKPTEAKVGDQIGFKDMVGTDRKGEVVSIEDGKYKIKAEDGTTHRVKPEKLQPIEQAEKAIKEGEVPAESETKLNEKIKSSKITLAKNDIPVLSGFVKDVIKPVAETVKDAFDIASKFLSPKSFASEKVKDILNEKLIGERNESKAKLDMMLRPMEKLFDELSNEDNVKFIDNLKSGKDQGSSELNEIANLIRKLDVDLYKKITEFNPNLTFKEDHYRVLWKVVPQSSKFAEIVKDFNSGKTIEEIAKERNLTNDEVDYTVKRSTQKGFKGLGKKPLRGTRGFFKQSTLSDMSEGIALGGIPKSYNPITMFKTSYADGMKYITAQNMWKTLGESKLTKFVKQGDIAPEGFEKINDNISKKYFPIKEQGEWWVDEGAARLINNHLSKDYFRGNEFGKGLMWLKNNFTAIELGLSAFHATAETMETISSSIGEGLRKTINLGIFGGDTKKILEGLTDIPKSIITPYTKVGVANKALKFMGEKDYINTPEGKSFIKKFPDAANLIHDYFVGGGTIGMSEDYKINAIKALKESLKEKSDDPAYKYIKAGVKALPAINEMIMRPLFDYYIPRLKLAMFLREHSISLQENQKRLEKGVITRSELARKNMAFVDDRLGEMNFDNLFWDRTFKTSMQFMFRSVTWKMGNLRAMGGAPIEQAIEFRNSFRENRTPLLTPKMAWMFGLTTMQVAFAYTLQKLFTDKEPKDFKDIVAPQINDKDEKERLILPTYFKDMLHFYHSPVKYVTGSFAGDIGRFYELQQNKDFFGYEIYDPQAPVSEKAKEIGEYFLPKPFSFTNLTQMKAKDEGLVKQSLSFLGFTKAPKYITNTPIENEIGDMYNMTNSLKKPHNAKEVSDVKGKIKELYKNGKEDEAYRLMTKSVSEGKLRATQTDWLLRNIDKKADLGEYMFRMLPYDDKKYLYNKMTEEEKAKYDPKETLKGQIKSENKPEGFGNNTVYYKYEKITSRLNSVQKEIDDIIKKKGSDEAIGYANKHKISEEYSFVKENKNKLEELRRVIEHVKKLPKDEQKEYQQDIEEVMDEVSDAFKSGEKIKLNQVINKLHREIIKGNKETRKEERETLKELD